MPRKVEFAVSRPLLIFQKKFQMLLAVTKVKYSCHIVQNITVMILNFSDRYVRANSADPDKTAPRGAV